METVGQRLRADWPHYAVVELTQAIVGLAGEYADTFALRAYDSVQLAAARSLQEMAGEEVQFACFDTRLCKAARTLGMASFP
jgi:predicted nucleic acid-binding protein